MKNVYKKHTIRHWHKFIFTTAPISAAGYSVIGWNHPGFGDSSVSHGYGSISLYTGSLFFLCVWKNEATLSCAVRGNGSGHMYVIQQTESRHMRDSAWISSQGLEQPLCVNALVSSPWTDGTISSIIKPCPVCLLSVYPLSTWCHAHDQHFQCDFSSCEAMKQVCCVYVVMVTGAALPHKWVQCHWRCGEVLC